MVISPLIVILIHWNRYIEGFVYQNSNMIYCLLIHNTCELKKSDSLIRIRVNNNTEKINDKCIEKIFKIIIEADNYFILIKTDFYFHLPVRTLPTSGLNI